MFDGTESCEGLPFSRETIVAHYREDIRDMKPITGAVIELGLCL
jgi:hypothetical protein